MSDVMLPLCYVSHIVNILEKHNHFVKQLKTYRGLEIFEEQFWVTEAEELVGDLLVIMSVESHTDYVVEVWPNSGTMYSYGNLKLTQDVKAPIKVYRIAPKYLYPYIPDIGI